MTRTLRASILVWLAATLVSGLAFFFGTGLAPIPWLGWLAAAPVLALAFERPGSGAWLAAFAAFFLGGCTWVAFLGKVTPWPILLVGLAVPSLVFALGVALAGRAARRLGSWPALIALPALWVSFELASSRLSPHGTSLSLAYTQAEVPPVARLAALTGLAGISFLLLLVPSGLALAFRERHRPRRAVALLGVTALGMALALAAAGWAASGPPEPTVRVGLAAADPAVPFFATENRAEALAVVARFEPQIAALAAQGARVVLLPEKLTGIAPAYEDEVFARFSAAARASQVYLVVGLNRIGRPQRLNSALVFGPDGRLLLDYTKRYLLPGFETGYAVGEVPGFFELDGRKVGVMICKDLDFPLWARRYSQAGARLVLAPAWDFVADGPLHAHMGQMRAIEQGFSLARSAQEGLLAAWDDRLRHRHETPTAAAPDVSLVVDLPLGRGPTLYSRWGDWLAWSSVVASLVLLAASWRRRQEG